MKSFINPLYDPDYNLWSQHGFLWVFASYPLDNFPRLKKPILDSAYKQVLSIHYVMLLEENQSLLQLSSILSTSPLGRTTLLTEKNVSKQFKISSFFLLL